MKSLPSSDPDAWLAGERQKQTLTHLQKRDVYWIRVVHLHSAKADELKALEVDLLGHLQRVIDLDAEVSDRTLEFPVPE